MWSERILRPWLFLPAQLAHDLSPQGLRILSLLQPLTETSWRPWRWRDLQFNNPIGLAAGADKNALNVQDWWRFRAGFIEVGTVTPKPQRPNPGKVIGRDLYHRAIWNRLGFPSDGSAAVLQRLSDLPQPRLTPIFVNIGKNRHTPNTEAHQDYQELARTFANTADAIVINVSSPNTEGLRELQSYDFLSRIIQSTKIGIQQADAQAHEATISRPRPPPILLKLSPDLDDPSFVSALDASLKSQVDGWILTNTTTTRTPGLKFPKEGGVSGGPLAGLAENRLKLAIAHLGTRREGRLIVSCGGISSASQVLKRLELGADLVQIYSALIFEGPWLFSKILRELRNKSATSSDSLTPLDLP